eukprot:1613537-Lingulodinium_polyedra.AAC.1
MRDIVQHCLRPARARARRAQGRRVCVCGLRGDSLGRATTGWPFGRRRRCAKDAFQQQRPLAVRRDQHTGD